MIKFPEKHRTLYGFSLIGSVLIEINIDLILKAFSVNSRKKLSTVVILPKNN